MSIIKQPQLELSVDHGQYSPDEASYALIAAYYDYGRPEEAINLYNHTLAKKNAPTLSNLYFKGRLMVRSERWREAESLFRKILQRLENHQFASLGYQVECKYWIALSLKKQNEISEAFQLTEKALAQSKKRRSDLEIEDPFENFKQIKNRLKKLHKELNKKA